MEIKRAVTVSDQAVINLEWRGKFLTGLLAFIMFLVMTATGIVYPIFPQLLLSFGAGASELGYLAAIFSLMITVFAPIGGWLADRVGKKNVLMVSIAGFSLANFLYAEASMLWELYVFRALEGIAGASVNPIAMALISIYTPKEKRATVIGILNSFAAAGFIVGPLFGGVLFQYFGLKAPFYVSGIAGMITVFLILWLIPGNKEEKQVLSKSEKEKEDSEGVHDDEKTMNADDHFFTYQFYWIALISFVSFFAWSLVEPGLAFYLYDHLLFSPSEFGFMVSLYGAFLLLFQPLGGRLGDRFPEKNVITLGFLVNVFSFLFLVYGETKLAIYVFGALAGLSGAIINPSAGATITKSVPREKRTTWMGIFSSLVNTAGFTGPIIGGIAYQKYGAFYTFMTATVLMGFIMVSFFLTYRNLPNETKKAINQEEEYSNPSFS